MGHTRRSRIIIIMMYITQREPGHPLARVKRRWAHSDYITKYCRSYIIINYYYYLILLLYIIVSVRVIIFDRYYGATDGGIIIVILF